MFPNHCEEAPGSEGSGLLGYNNAGGGAGVGPRRRPVMSPNTPASHQSHPLNSANCLTRCRTLSHLLSLSETVSQLDGSAKLWC